MFERAKFYSTDDLGNTMELTRAGEVLDNYKEGQELNDINDAIELYNIKLLLDNHLALKSWSDEQIMSYVDKTKTFGKHIVAFFRQNLSDVSAVNLYKGLFQGYEQDFWDVIESYGLIDLLSPKVVTDILDKAPDDIEYILHCSKLVKAFDAELSDFLKKYSKAAELLVNAYLIKDISDRKRAFVIPAGLTNDNKCEIVSNYLDSPCAKLGSTRIIMQASDVDGLRLTPKIRLKAKQLEPKLAVIPEDAIVTGLEVGFSIEFSQREGISPVSISLDNLIQKFVYSEKYLDKLDDKRLLDCFNNLFRYTDEYGLVTLCFNENENIIFERIYTQEVKGLYRLNDSFRMKNNIAISQLVMFDGYLRRKGKTLESLIKNYYEVHFYKDYGFPSHSLSLPKDDDSFANKNKVIAPEMESVIKIFDLFVEEGEINPELYEYKMGLPITLAKSLLYGKHKYAIIKDGPNPIYGPLRLLFSDQTLLGFVEPYKEAHYHSLYNLLSSGKPVYYTNYEPYQKQSIDQLIENGYLKIVNNDQLVFDNYPKIMALLQLWNRREISYYHCEPDVRVEIDKMVQDGWLQYDDYLLSPSERHYVNFYLNNSEFSNGFQLRNKYSHGVSSCFASDKEHKNAYYYFLMIFIILLLKMDEDMRLAIYLNGKLTKNNIYSQI